VFNYDQVQQIVESICNHYSVGYKFQQIDSEGYADLFTQEVILSKSTKSLQLLLSVLIHEIGHIVALRNNKWMIYHDPKIATVENCIRYGWQAERYVDNWAAKEFTILFRGTGLKYKRGYLKANKRFCKQALEKHFRGVA
jgi:hypothetical protein